VEQSAARKVPVVLLANRLAGMFVAVVLTLAVATFIVKYQRSSASALDDAIALLIVTCPCALALATPLAITVAVGRAAGNGVLVKGGDALELLSAPATLVLDKTGTLTEGRSALVDWYGPEWVKPLVLSLEEGSSHPLADGFRRAWPDMQRYPVSDAHHVVGGGLEGIVNGHRVRIGSPRFVRDGATDLDHAVRVRSSEFDTTLTPVFVAVDGVIIAAAGMGDRIRDDAQQSLDALRAMGWKTVMLSGDVPEVARAVGRSLGFAAEDIVGGASPEDKLAFVKERRIHGRVVMVGDGVNDAAAIAAATVGIGVHGGAEACLATADVYLAKPGLGALVELVVGARRTMRVIRRNIVFSIGYNIVGAGLAVAGVLTPLIAAVLMPASSITVILGSWYGRSFTRQPGRGRS
jgi:Cu2+-exporting ATPase